ncbi:MAG: hypothetical protein EOP08_14115 [Proteobacteria bacterium]|nr:MAG: hypothetical protein EOP08_14115 [Pseudomonadota bacterium]
MRNHGGELGIDRAVEPQVKRQVEGRRPQRQVHEHDRGPAHERVREERELEKGKARHGKERGAGPGRAGYGPRAAHSLARAAHPRLAGRAIRYALSLLVQLGFWVLAFAISAAGCAGLRTFALRRSLVDIPNERSLHAVPVPRIGGVALCVASWVSAAAALAFTGERELSVWVLLAIPVFVVGLVDDLRPVSAAVRFGLQLAVAIAFVWFVRLPPAFVLWPGFGIAVPAALAYPLAVVWIVGVVNIYNFMDGMDGIAAVQTIGAGLALAVGFSSRHQSLSFVSASLVAAMPSIPSMKL